MTKVELKEQHLVGAGWGWGWRVAVVRETGILSIAPSLNFEL